MKKSFGSDIKLTLSLIFQARSRSSEVIVFCATFVFFDLVCDLCTGQGVHSGAHRLLLFSGRLS